MSWTRVEVTRKEVAGFGMCFKERSSEIWQQLGMGNEGKRNQRYCQVFGLSLWLNAAGEASKRNRLGRKQKPGFGFECVKFEMPTIYLNAEVM